MNRVWTPQLRTGALALAAIATISIAACGTTSASPPGAGSSASAKGASGGVSTDAVTWTKNFCTAENTAFSDIKTEQTAFNSVNFSSDNATAQQQEVTHLKKYQATANAEIASLQNGGSPDVPAGPGFVSGLLKAWQTFAAVVQTGLNQANALDPTSSTFTDDLNTVSSTVTTGFSTLGDQYGAAVDQVNAQGSADNQPFIHTYNTDCNNA